MPYKIQYSTLNASTAQILNVIRENASIDYQSNVPEVAQSRDILRVGQCILGEASLMNEFVSALVNRIALVRIRSAVFYNPYAELKKGVLTLGETVEEAYIGLAKAMCFSAVKAEKREFKRYIPEVKTAFHAINWRVLYPLSIERKDLEKAFMSENGVTDFIMRLMDSIFTGASYDEYLLFKYLIIKAYNNGGIYVDGITGNDIHDDAAEFRGVSNMLTFVSDRYNQRRVQTATPRENQHIFMDAKYNARFDVDVLSAAFNMDKADFLGRLHLVDSFTTFDNDRFDDIRAECDGLEEVTPAELAKMGNVVAVLVDDEWFQIYDTLENGGIMTEKEVASGLRWNYFYHVWKTVSISPFSNAVAFIKGAGDSESFAAQLASIPVTVVGKDESAEAYTLTLAVDTPENTNNNFYDACEFSVEAPANKQIACHKYGAMIVPKYALTEGGEVVTNIPAVVTIYGNVFKATIDIETVKTGDSINFAKAE